jgi:branched-chain amino acid transport system ATP-binding protein
MVEQNARSALSIADRGVVLSLGRVVADQEPAELAADERLHHAYLGFYRVWSWGLSSSAS